MILRGLRWLFAALTLQPTSAGALGKAQQAAKVTQLLLTVPATTLKTSFATMYRWVANFGGCERRGRFGGRYAFGRASALTFSRGKRREKNFLWERTLPW